MQETCAQLASSPRKKNAQGPRPPGVISSFEPRLVWIGRRAISVRGILAPCLVFGGVTGAAQALQVPRFAPQRRRTLQFPAVVDIGTLAEPDQADAASLALVASIVQRPGAGGRGYGRTAQRMSKQARADLHSGSGLAVLKPAVRPRRDQQDRAGEAGY